MMNNLNEIATIASTRLSKNTTKPQAYEIIRAMIERGTMPNLDDQARLYKHFSPNTPKAKTPFRWVYLATSKETTRPYLNYVYVTDKGLMVATDGHRLHCHETTLAPGFYDKNMILVDVDLTFPDWERIVPKNKGVIKVNTSETCVGSGFSGKPTETYKLQNGGGINVKYWNDAIQKQSPDRVYQEHKNDPLLLTYSDTHFAVVMPMRLAQ